MTESTAPPSAPEFSSTELQQFQKDDLAAGKFIGKTLVLMFLYSAIVMGGVIWWTWSNVSDRTTPPVDPTSAN